MARGPSEIHPKGRLRNGTVVDKSLTAHCRRVQIAHEEVGVATPEAKIGPWMFSVLEVGVAPERCRVHVGVDAYRGGL